VVRELNTSAEVPEFKKPACAWDISKILSVHTAVNWYITFYRPWEGESGEEVEWCLSPLTLLPWY